MLSVSYLRTLSLLVSTLFFLLSLLPTTCEAQNQSKIDSLQRLLHGGDMLQQIDLRRAIVLSESSGKRSQDRLYQSVSSGVPNTIDVAKIEDHLFEILDIERKKSMINGIIFFVILKENAREIGVKFRDATGNVILVSHEELLSVDRQFTSTIRWTREFNALILGYA
jgi:hypothetical protein